MRVDRLVADRLPQLRRAAPRAARPGPRSSYGRERGRQDQPASRRSSCWRRAARTGRDGRRADRLVGADLARLEAGVSHGPAHGPDVVEVVIPRPAARGGGAQAHPGQRRATAGAGPRPGVAGSSSSRPRRCSWWWGRRPCAGPPSTPSPPARSPGHGRALATYGRALAQRNSLLRAIREGTAGTRPAALLGRAPRRRGRRDRGRPPGRPGATLGGPLAAAHRRDRPGEGRLAHGAT